MSIVPVPTIPTVDPIQALGTALVGFLVGKYILSENGVPAQLAKAQQIAAFTSALIEVNSNQAAGVADLQTAIQNLVASVQNQAAALALNELLATLSTQLAALESTIIGKLQGAVMNLLLSQINQVANYYVATLSAPVTAK